MKDGPTYLTMLLVLIGIIIIGTGQWLVGGILLALATAVMANEKVNKISDDVITVLFRYLKKMI